MTMKELTSTNLAAKIRNLEKMKPGDTNELGVAYETHLSDVLLSIYRAIEALDDRLQKVGDVDARLRSMTARIDAIDRKVR
jgi:hypothetical protein